LKKRERTHPVYFFGYQVLMYTLLVVNYRYVAAASYVGSVVSDGLIACASFAAIQNIAQSKNRVDRLCYTAGGMVGSVLGVFISKRLMGK
jgi:hypothetical protein